MRSKSARKINVTLQYLDTKQTKKHTITHTCTYAQRQRKIGRASANREQLQSEASQLADGGMKCNVELKANLNKTPYQAYSPQHVMVVAAV